MASGKSSNGMALINGKTGEIGNYDPYIKRGLARDGRDGRLQVPFLFVGSAFLFFFLQQHNRFL